MVAHAAYPAVTHDSAPASLSKVWITDVLRKKVGYKGLVVSDDLEMGGVSSAVPVEQAAVAHIRAGGDICLICHTEEVIRRAHEALIREAEGNTKFARQVTKAAQRIAKFKKKTAALRRRAPVPTPQSVQRLTRQIWEFSEQVRLEDLARQEQA
jgi:beta-N-acetylhexosaminidase